MDLTDGGLQYGALGLLAIFVAGFIVWLREREKASIARQIKYDGWIQSLVDRALQARDQEILAYQALANLTAEAQSSVAKGLADLSKDNERHSRSSAERHKATMLQFGTICNSLAEMTGKMDKMGNGTGTDSQG